MFVRRFFRTVKLLSLIKTVVAATVIIAILTFIDNKVRLNPNFHVVNHSPSIEQLPEDYQCVLPFLKEPTPLKTHNNSTVKCNYKASIGIGIESGKLRIRDKKAKCFYNSIIRVNDFKTAVVNESISIQHGDDIPSDHFIVSCESDNKVKETLPLLGIKARSDLTGERSRLTPSEGALGYNVVFLGFDSVSRLAFLRNLPSSFNYFVNELDGVVLKKHNILGDGTTVNLLGILTGHKETELHEARKGRKGAKPVDDFPWIFKEFKKAGYVTQHAEDNQFYGTFQYRLLGFVNSPTDHYARPFTLKFHNQGKCSGPTPRHLLFFNYLREFYKVYDRRVKKFSFIFHSESSHNVQSDLLAVDMDLVDLLREFQPGGLFGESILFLFGDHGARFSSHRSTMQGKYEERLPFFGVHLPKSLKRKHPDYLQNFRYNSEFLTSHLDVHATLLHILGLPSIKADRSHNLFRALSRPRSCSELSIEPHWCVCSNWQNITLTDHRVIKAANAAVDFLNSIVSNMAVCVKHSLVNVTSAEISESNSALLAFKKSADNDGYKADLSDKMNTMEEIYRITFYTSPSMALFEVTGHLDLIKKKFNFFEKQISRINAYGSWIKCLKDDYPHLRKYCVCRDAL